MGQRYAAVSISGYNATPPSDTGVVAEENRVTWAKIKTKLPDPLKTALELVDSRLQTHVDIGPNSYTSNQTLGVTHHNAVNQVSGVAVTLSLSDAASLTAGWFTKIVNTDSTNSVTIARATPTDTINGTAANFTLPALHAVQIEVNAAADGFLLRSLVINPVTTDTAQTISGAKTFSGLSVFDGAATANRIPARVNSTSNTDIVLQVNCGAGSTNPITQANDSALFGSGSSVNTGVLVIAPWSTVATGIRFDGANNTVVATAGTVDLTVATTGVDIDGVPVVTETGTQTLTNKTLTTPDLNGSELILDADADTSITADTDDQIDFKAGGIDVAKIIANGSTATIGGVIDRDVTTVDVVNTTVETTIYSFSVPANTLGTNRVLRLTIIGDILNDTGVNATITEISGFYGVTQVFSELGLIDITDSASRRAFLLTFELHAKGATNSQVSTGSTRMSPGGTVDGTTASPGAIFDRTGIHNAIAEDSTGSLDLAFKVTLAAASVSFSFRKLSALLEIL